MLRKIRSERNRLMEVPKKEAHSRQKIALQRICLMEALEEKVRSWTEKFVASERKRRVEEEKEALPFSEVPLLHLRLGPRHRYFLKSLESSFFFSRECANARPSWIQWDYINILH